MYVSVDVLWVLIGSALIFFMQAGFAMCEAGFTRIKNTGNILMKNLMDFVIGTIAFLLIGFGIMHGSGNGFIGSLDIFVTKNYDFGTIPKYAFLIFQTVFCGASATIVSGAMAERTSFKAYCIYSACITALIYPISGHWIWGGGWLEQMGFHDFAGGTAVHTVGGVAALVGAIALGPRYGKYDKNGDPVAIPGHNVALSTLGIFILWFAWFGFDGASTLSMTGDNTLEKVSMIFVNTNLSAAVSAFTAMCYTWKKYGKPDITMTINGVLAGLVGITAGCDTVSPLGAAIIGIITGFSVVYFIDQFEKTFKVDDPVGAVSVHGVCGIIGTIAVGFLSTSEGLLYGKGARLLAAQIIGSISVIIWAGITTTIAILLIKKFVGLRVSKEAERDGLDFNEHGLVSAYNGFVVNDIFGGMNINKNTNLGEDVFARYGEKISQEKAKKVDKNEAVPVIKEENIPNLMPTGMHKITILLKQSKFEDLKHALNDVGVTGMTVSNVMGCGIQKGIGEFYRGVEVESTLLPKMQVDVIIGKLDVDTVINAIKDALYTGHIGDGKIFVYDVKRVVKVRTGEENFDALQDIE